MDGLRQIAVVFTGGTISMVNDSSAGGVVPTLDGAGILARTPGVEAIAVVVALDWGRKPASHLTFPELLDLAATIRARSADPTVDGVVVVQGTDTIEESAFAFDLLVDTAKPVVVTGAMRDASQPDDDGPANLRAAIAAAASD
ncbi:MAG TPA: asparaginase domain-containing protein, partial [Patescibacteria group bacterium]|nr:asparaginase domain-containing protein [Patescibacteria group bacterium]